MTQHQNEHQYDDGARLARRYNGAVRAHKVTFGPFALLVGTGVTHVILAIGVAVSFSWNMPGALFITFILAVLWGIPITLVGCVLALVLGLALRPIESQTLHVLAFFGVFAVLSALITLLASGSGLGALFTGAIVGAAAAIGRASVWKLVTVHPKKPETTEHRAE